MNIYELFFENQDVQGYLAAGGYDGKKAILDLTYAGNLKDIHMALDAYLLRTYCLYEKLDIEEVRQCLYLELAQLSAVSVLAGISDWDANRIKRGYYRSVACVENLEELRKVNMEFFLAFTDAVNKHRKMKTYSPFTQQVLDYISQVLESKITIPMLASHFYCSESHLSHCFKQDVGIAVMEYVIAQKVNASKPLIRQNLPLAQIAEQLSFSSQSHFSKAFRKTTGVSPMTWKKSAGL